MPNIVVHNNSKPITSSIPNSDFGHFIFKFGFQISFDIDNSIDGHWPLARERFVGPLKTIAKCNLPLSFAFACNVIHTEYTQQQNELALN